MNPAQFRADILRPTLEYLGDKFTGEAAENLLMGTAAQESNFKYIRQINGPALGLFQMEPATLKDLYDNHLAYHPHSRIRLNELLGIFPDRYSALQSNLAYAVATCRLQYYRFPEALPAADDIEGLAQTWKTRWNTAAGKGTVEQFIENYERYVLTK